MGSDPWPAIGVVVLVLLVVANFSISFTVAPDAVGFWIVFAGLSVVEIVLAAAALDYREERRRARS